MNDWDDDSPYDEAYGPSDPRGSSWTHMIL